MEPPDVSLPDLAEYEPPDELAGGEVIPITDAVGSTASGRPTKRAPSEEAIGSTADGVPTQVRSTAPEPPTPDYEPFPDVWKLDFSELVGQVAKARMVDRSAADFAALLGLSAIYGPAMEYCPIDGWQKQCGLYGCLLTASGKGKSRLLDVFTRPLPALEEELQEAAADEINESKRAVEQAELRKRRAASAFTRAKNDAEAKKAEAALRQATKELCVAKAAEKKLPVVWYSSATMEKIAAACAANDGLLALVSPETPMFGIAAGGYSKNGDAQVETLNSGFDGDYVGDGRMTRDDVKIRPLLACAFGTQPKRLRKYLRKSDELVYSGMLARFVLFEPVDLSGYRDQTPYPLDEKAVSRWVASVVRTAKVLRQERPVFRFTEEARDSWTLARKRWETEMRPGGRLAGLYGFNERVSDIACRIAALLQVHHHGPYRREVREEVLRQAVLLTDWLIDQTASAYAKLGIGEQSTLAGKLLAYIDRKGRQEITLRELMTNGPGQKKYSATQHTAALKVLVDARQVSLHKEQTGRPGRPQITVTRLKGDTS